MEEEQRQAPADAVQVTDDGVLQKLVLQEGTGELPPLHARCLGGQCAGHEACNMAACRRPRLRPLASYTAVAFTLVAPAVHYVGYLASSGEVFMDTRKESQNEEPTTLVAGRGECRHDAHRVRELCHTLLAADFASVIRAGMSHLQILLTKRWVST